MILSNDLRNWSFANWICLGTVLMYFAKTSLDDAKILVGIGYSNIIMDSYKFYRIIPNSFIDSTLDYITVIRSLIILICLRERTMHIKSISSDDNKFNPRSGNSYTSTLGHSLQ